MRLLIIRFSSFGDIVQAMSVVDDLASQGVSIEWVTRTEFSNLISLNTNIAKVWGFDRKLGLVGLFKLGLQLKKRGYNFIYDAHSNLRSRILCGLLCPLWMGPRLIRRSKHRIKRFLLFNLGVNKFPRPFRGMVSYRRPLAKYFDLPASVKSQSWNFPRGDSYRDRIVICPGATWEMKRWPLEHWKSLINLLKDVEFTVVGGPSDDFCRELEQVAPDRVTNMAGKLSLEESCRLVAGAKVVVAADTGHIHVADLLGVPSILLMGPTAFGFPSNANTIVLEEDLPCRPCTKDGRGRCSQSVWQKCMVDITPRRVADKVLELL